MRTPSLTRVSWAPRAGRIEVRVSASLDRDCMLAAWLVGTGREDECASGEVCIFEMDAAEVGETTVARSGLKAHDDPRLTSDMTQVELPFNASKPHTWTAIWGEGQTIIGCEGSVVRHLRQAPDYPLFFMLDLFDIGSRGPYPKTAIVHSVRGWLDE